MLHSIYDLTTFCKATTGDVPPKLIVCSYPAISNDFAQRVNFQGRFHNRGRFKDVSIRLSIVFQIEVLAYAGVTTGRTVGNRAKNCL
jgi:hypothetical protein